MAGWPLSLPVKPVSVCCVWLSAQRYCMGGHADSFCEARGDSFCEEAEEMEVSCFLVQGRLSVGQFWVPKEALHLFVGYEVLTLCQRHERRDGRLTREERCA